jgi:hypothetical protein
MEKTRGVTTSFAAEDVVEQDHYLRERENTEPKVRYEPIRKGLRRKSALP